MHHVAPLRALQWLSSSQQKSLFTFSNDHDFAQETVIELIQQEVDEEVASLHRNWREEINNR